MLKDDIDEGVFPIDDSMMKLMEYDYHSTDTLVWFSKQPTDLKIAAGLALVAISYAVQWLVQDLVVPYLLSRALQGDIKERVLQRRKKRLSIESLESNNNEEIVPNENRNVQAVQRSISIHDR